MRLKGAYASGAHGDTAAITLSGLLTCPREENAVRMPGIMNSTPSPSQGFGSPILVTSDNHHDQQANQTPLRRRVGEHEYDHSKTVKGSKDIISSACLQSVNSTLPTDVQVTDDSDTVFEYGQLYSNSCPSDDLPCPSENCSFAKNVKGSLDSCSLIHDQVGSSDNPSLYNESKVSDDNISFREDQLCSKNTGFLTENCEASGYVCFHFEDFKETKPFCSLTEEFKVSNESLLRKRDEELQGSTDLNSLTEDDPLTDEEQKSKYVHYRSPTPEGLQESNYLDSFCKDEKMSTKNSPWIIERFRHLSFCIWDTQRSKHVHEEVGPRSLHKSNEDEKETLSILDASKSTYRPMPHPSVGRKDNIPFESSDVHVLVHNTLILIRPMSRAITKTCILVFMLLLLLLQTTAEVSDVPLDCTSKVHLTSANYPSNYPNDANMKWHVTAPSGRWILVEFNDFDLEKTFDFLDLLDITDISNRGRFTGERTQIPSFLTQGNELNATFASFGFGTRKGFNITVSCYEKSNTRRGRLVGGNTFSEGSLELLSQSGEWVGVCEDNLSATVAEAICRELGFPGVKEISHSIDGCHLVVNDKTCIKAPSCEDNTYLLQDCIFSTGNCTTFSSAEIKCYEPGFKGCYQFEVGQLQNGSTHDSTPKCISSCRGRTPHAIAIFDGQKCFCSTASQIKLLEKKLAQNQTTCPRPAKNNQQIVNALVYNASVGFCNQTDDVINGTWDSNITFFGSIVKLTCDDGYSRALQCVPGESSYHPEWNDSIPTCDRFDGGTSSSSSSSSNSDTPEAGQSLPPEISTLDIILFGIFLPILIILIICIIVLVIEKKTNRYILRPCLARVLMSISRNSRHRVPTVLQRKRLDSGGTVEEDIDTIEEIKKVEQE